MYRSKQVSIQYGRKGRSNHSELNGAYPCPFHFLGPPHEAVEKQPTMGRFG